MTQTTQTVDSFDTTVEETSEIEFRKFMVKLIYKGKDDVRNKIRENTQEIKDNFNKEIKILKKNQSEILKMKESINLIKSSM